MAKAVVIYHDNCMDKMGAAWAFHRLAGHLFAEVEYIPARYGNPPPVLASNPDQDILYILDFSFPRETLKWMCQGFAAVVLLDHHKTAEADLTHWEDQPTNLQIEFDMSRSGAGITWDYFSKGTGKRRPEIIDYIEDRDLWRFKKYCSKEVNAFIAAHPLLLDAYTEIHNTLESQLYTCSQIGAYLLKAHDKNVQTCIKSSKRRIFVDGIEGLVCNCSPMFASDVGNILAVESGTFGATFYQNSDGDFNVSLRSIPSSPVDVSALAKAFGGGGHRNAAGFTVREIVDNVGSIQINPV